MWRRCYLADDWTAFDDSLSDKMRESMLHATQLQWCLREAKASQIPFDKLYLSPSDALLLPTPAELSSRHPDFTGAQIAELLIAYEHEVTVLSDLISQHHLTDWVNQLLAE